MKIAIIVEGRTEEGFLPAIRIFLETRLVGRMPRLKAEPRDGRIPVEAKLKREVELLLRSFDHVVALTDVYTGTSDFLDAADARAKMRSWVGPEPRFHPHAAQYDVEAWLIPFWPRIQALTGTKRLSPSTNPENINHNHPPAHVLADVFRTGTRTRRRYVKTRDSAAILSGQNLETAARACGELKDFLNTILDLCGGQIL